MNTPPPMVTAAVHAAFNDESKVADLSDAQLAVALGIFNTAYRAGTPLISDAVFDHVILAELKSRNPSHPYFDVPEPEADEAFVGERYRHTEKMLSTDKAYSQAEIDAFVKRVTSAANDLGIEPQSVKIRVTAKLDGLAAYDYGDALVTRGRDQFGADVQRVLAAGVVSVGGRARGPGELVVEQVYFDEQIAEQFALEHPRNYMAGLVSSETVKEHHRPALEAGVCRFVRYETLPSVFVGLSEFTTNWERMMLDAQQVPYLCDGAVAEVVDGDIRARMGSTSHHHRYMMALKRNDVEAETVVVSVDLSCGRTGRIIPTLSLRPVKMYGVTIARATAHTAQHLLDLKLGAGAVVRIVRGGGIIPKLTSIITPSAQPMTATHCPSCGVEGVRVGKHLVCEQSATCPAQSARRIEHFFHTINVCRGFGSAVTEALSKAGIADIAAIYRMDVQAFTAVAGISAGVAKNLVAELKRSQQEPLSDALLLGAMGVPNLGRGDSRKVLAHVPIEQLETLTAERLRGIHGFGEQTSEPIIKKLAQVLPTLKTLLALGFNLDRTPLASQVSTAGALGGKTVVFTGTMQSGDRKDMEVNARKLGANIGSGVTSKTDYLICGDRVGATKTSKAASLGVKVISEADYLALIA